ncbi:E3 ubiquitin-protein ligase TRIM39-like [Plectropomus leopardus]|uniref:E3 ubiquitin-protein ligase TRIM39-like n=1 Tax=Plectropomus leopardus TaxID=160734 RepID=UPI001C4C84EA|nr:E3 ubiquitin-protein ligase TRIM39-like [Plectropomus leopardus]XP_042342100.1 E3 ubiquitin-protein ligase TRIM39-like [Plectropomus leopardus]
MGTVEETLKCPVCQDFFTDPVTLPCRHDFCLTCIQAVWETDGSDVGPFFCPECQIFLQSDLTLEVNTSLQAKVKDFTTNRPSTAELQTATPSRESSSTVLCDHCIETSSVAIRTCLTCDASLCQAHALLHQQRSALREHTLVEVTGDPLSLKCREHRDELKLFCMEDRVPVCCLCVLVGTHKNHRASQLHDACKDFKSMLETTMNQLLKRRSEAEHAIKDLETLYTQTVKSAADFREKISDKYSRIRVVLDGDERLMMQIIDAEESYMTEWLEAQRGIMETQIKQIDSLRASSKSLLQETNELQFLQQITALNLCDPLDLAPIQEVNKDLCDLEKLRTVERLVDDLSVALSQHFPRMWSNLSCPALDSKSAHPKLEISQDKKQVYWRREPVSDAPSPRPYDSQYSVLAQESFTSGRHYWEVIVQEKPYWLMGVTTGSADKKDSPSQTSSSVSVNNTSWCIYHGDGQYLACHDTQEKQLSVGKRVKKLGILANLQKGELSFYDADTTTLLHSFCMQCTEPLYPMFNPCIDVNGLNKQPLTLFWIKDPWDWHVNEDEVKK